MVEDWSSVTLETSKRLSFSSNWSHDTIHKAARRTGVGTPSYHTIRHKWSWPAKAHIDPDLIATVLFCAIGLLVMLIVMLSFPDLGALIEQYNQF